jgi:hypothetical protein
MLGVSVAGLLKTIANEEKYNLDVVQEVIWNKGGISQQTIIHFSNHHLGAGFFEHMGIR